MHPWPNATSLGPVNIYAAAGDKAMCGCAHVNETPAQFADHAIAIATAVGRNQEERTII